MKNIKQKRFTLIELIIVIVVIGILAGMALPKFLGVQRDAKVSAMFRDIDTLEKTIMLYYQDNDTLPLYELDDNNFNVANTLTDTLNRKGDDVSKLKVIDKSKLKNYLSKDTKYGKDKTEDDEYLYSELTGNVYYSAGLQNGKGITYHTYENANEDPIYRDENGKILTALKDVKIGDTLLSGNRNTINEDPNNNFTGLVKKGDTLKVEINGVDVSSQVQIKDINENEIASNSLLKQVKAANEEYNQFTLPVNLDKTAVNKVKMKIPEENSTAIFLVDFVQDTLLEAPDVDVDINSNPYQLVVNYPEGLDIAETQYIIDGKDTTTTKPDLTPLMDKKTHTIEVRYKTTDNKLSEWASVSFTYSDGNVEPNPPKPPIDEKPSIPETKFSKVFGGSLYEQFNAVTQTSDGGYIAVGYTTSRDGDFASGVTDNNANGLIVKFDKDSNIQWSKIIGDEYTNFKAIEETEDGGFVIAGVGKGKTVGTDILILKIDKDGNELWKNIKGSLDTDTLADFKVTNDGYIACGTTIGGGDFDTSKGTFDTLMIKYDKSGNIVWSKVLGGENNDEFKSVTLTNDGGYIAVGYTMSTTGDFDISKGGPDDALIVKFDNTGNVVWSKVLGGTKTDKFEKIVEISDGNYLVEGFTMSTDSNIPSVSTGKFFTTFDKYGNILSVKNIGMNSWSTYSMKNTKDKGVIIAGNINNDATLIKLNSKLDIIWQTTISGDKVDTFTNVFETTDGGYITCGYTNSTSGELSSGNGKDNVVLIKFNKDGQYQ